MFPNEKRKLSAGCTEDKTEGRAGGLHKKAMRGLQKRAALRTALFRSPV